MSAVAMPQTVETDSFEASLGYAWFRMMKVVETMRKKMKRTKMQMKRHWITESRHDIEEVQKGSKR